MQRDMQLGSGDLQRIGELAARIEDYENREFPVEPPTPVEAIRFRMEQMGLTEADLVQYIGSAKKVAQVLAGEMPLTLTMIRALHMALGIPRSVLDDSEIPF